MMLMPDYDAAAFAVIFAVDIAFAAFDID